MRTQSSAEILARIAAHRADVTARAGGDAREGVLAFDGDGTLWSGDVGDDFLRAMFEAGDVREPARDALSRAAAAHGLAGDGTGVELARRVYEGYARGVFPEPLMCEVTTWLCAGWTRDAVGAFCRDLVEARGLLGRLQREAIRVLEWARAEGLDVYVVSASPAFVVEAAAAVLGLGPDRVVALVPVVDGAGVVTTELHRPIAYGPGKVEGLRARVGDRPLYAAFGDNVFDVPLLQAAGVPVAVRPKARLRDAAGAVPALVEMIAE